MSSAVTRRLLPHLLRRTTTALHHHTTTTTIPKLPPSLPNLQPQHQFPFLPFPDPILRSRLHPTRSFSTHRRNPTRSTKPDIGARARQLQNRRLWTYALTFSCIAGFVVIALNQFQDQLVFYVTPTDLLAKYAENPTKSRFRLGGLVLENSVCHPAGGKEMEFVVTDLITDILVRYEGSLPDLFREGHSVVVEGMVEPFTEEIRDAVDKKGVSEKARSGECYFSAAEVLAKHDEKYMPAEVASAIEKNKKILAEASAGENIQTVGNVAAEVK